MSNSPLIFNSPFYKDAWALTKPYWVSKEKWSAIALFILFLTCIVGTIAASVGFNHFHRDFYNALQHFNQQAITDSLVQFCYVVILYTLSVSGADYFLRALSIRWRRWLTENYLSKWLANHTHYQAQITQINLDNPDQRISEDLDNFPTMTLKLFQKFFHSSLLLFTFSIILWNLSALTTFSIGKAQITIPGYFCIIAVLCAAVGTFIIKRIGKSLVYLDYQQQKMNANFRFSLVRLRESSEQIAIYQGEPSEKNSLMKSFSPIFNNFVRINWLKSCLALFVKCYEYIYYIISFAISIPLYLAKLIQLGTVTQISSAFNSVASGLSVIIEAFTDLADWRAVVFRIQEFDQSMKQLDQQKQHQCIQHEQHTGDDIVIRHLQLTLPNGLPLLHPLTLQIAPGKKIRLCGPTGIGKSILLRAISGIWPYGQGFISLPKQARMLFISQKPYLPLGTLKDALVYPFNHPIDDNTLTTILQRCHLDKFINKLHDHNNWPYELSLGEQQLIAFARIFLYQPDMVFLDEASSALDEATELKIHDDLKSFLPNTTIVSVNHRNNLAHFYDDIINLLHQPESQLRLMRSHSTTNG